VAGQVLHHNAPIDHPLLAPQDTFVLQEVHTLLIRTASKLNSCVQVEPSVSTCEDLKSAVMHGELADLRGEMVV
jgi:hypothetical protein